MAVAASAGGSTRCKVLALCRVTSVAAVPESGRVVMLAGSSQPAAVCGVRNTSALQGGQS